MLISRAAPVWNPVFWQKPCEVAKSLYRAGIAEGTGTDPCHCSLLATEQNGGSRGNVIEPHDIMPGKKGRSTTPFQVNESQRRKENLPCPTPPGPLYFTLESQRGSFLS